MQEEKIGLVTQILTEDDNKTHNVFKVLVFLATLCGIVYAGYALFADKTFSLSDYGTGVGILLAGAGGALGFNKLKS